MYLPLDFSDLKDQLKAVLRTREGQLVLGRILAYTDPLRPVLSTDHDALVRMLGKHDVHLGLRSAILERAPELFMKVAQTHSEYSKRQEYHDE